MTRDDALVPSAPLAVLLLGGEEDLGPLLVRMFLDQKAGVWSQALAASVGVFDHTVLDQGAEPGLGFQGADEARRLEERTRRSLEPVVARLRAAGFRAELRVAVAADPVEGVAELAKTLRAEWPHAVFFVAKLVFPKRRWYHRLLHPPTADALRARLEGMGLPVQVLPVVVPA